MQYPWLESSKQNILSLLKQDRSLLIYGLQGIGKKYLALEAAKIKLCESNNACNKCQNCNLMNQNTHPDLILLEPSIDKKTISIDSIHEIIELVQQTSYMGKGKFVIIYCIEQLTIPASNALLKNLEEPNKNINFILISHNKEQIINTIKSRCLEIFIPSPSFEQGKNYIMLNNKNLPDSVVKILSHQPLISINYNLDFYYEIINMLLNVNRINNKVFPKNQQDLLQFIQVSSYWLYDLLSFVYTGRCYYFTQINQLPKIKFIEKIYACWNYIKEMLKNQNFSLNNKLLIHVFLAEYRLIFKD